MIYVGPAARAAVIVKRPAAALSRAARAIQHLPPGTIVASLFLYCGPVAAIFLTVPRCVNVRVPSRYTISPCMSLLPEQGGQPRSGPILNGAVGEAGAPKAILDEVFWRYGPVKREQNIPLTADRSGGRASGQ